MYLTLTSLYLTPLFTSPFILPLGLPSTLPFFFLIPVIIQLLSGLQFQFRLEELLIYLRFEELVLRLGLSQLLTQLLTLLL